MSESAGGRRLHGSVMLRIGRRMTDLPFRLSDRYAKLGLGRGGRRPGAGRKPSTIPGILKRLPPEAAELLIREIKAKAELIQVQIKLDLLKQAEVSGEIPASAVDGNEQRTNKIASSAHHGFGLSEKQVKSDQECMVSRGPEQNCSTPHDSLVSTDKKEKRATQGLPSGQITANSETLAYLKWKLSRFEQA